MPFNNDEQRKAVMANLNKSRKVSSRSVSHSSIHPGPVRPNKMLQRKGLPNWIVSELERLDKEQYKNGKLNIYDNHDPVNGSMDDGIKYHPGEIKIPEEELRKTGLTQKEYVESALDGKPFKDLNFHDNKLTKQQRKEQQRKWGVIVDNNLDDERIKRFFAIEDYLVQVNKEIRKIYDETPSFWRGTSFDEVIRWYSESGALNSENYNYYPITLDPNKAAHLFGKGVLIEFDGDSIRNRKPTLVEYTAEPVPLGLSKSVATASNQGKDMSYRFIDELEVRLPSHTSIKRKNETIPSDHRVKIRNIYIDKKRFDENKYRIERLRDEIDANIIVVDSLYDTDFRKGKYKQISVNWDDL